MHRITQVGLVLYLRELVGVLAGPENFLAITTCVYSRGMRPRPETFAELVSVFTESAMKKSAVTSKQPQGRNSVLYNWRVFSTSLMDLFLAAPSCGGGRAGLGSQIPRF